MADTIDSIEQITRSPPRLARPGTRTLWGRVSVTRVGMGNAVVAVDVYAPGHPGDAG